MLPKLLTSRLQTILQSDYDTVIEAFSHERKWSFRINTLKWDGSEVFPELEKKWIKIEKFEKISGVYFLFREKRLVYIGESECVLSRLSQHFKEKIKEFDAYKVFKLIPNMEERKREEARLIKKFRPVLNFTHNRNMNKI